MVNKKSLKEPKKIVDFLINNYEFKDNVISIYAMGSFIERTFSKLSDIDLNIFLKKADFKELYALRKVIRITEQKFGRKVDTNIISEKELKVVSSIVFPHKYRHALLIFEIKHYNCLLYGIDILKDVKIDYAELYEETIKLLLTLGYRIRKIYLTSRMIKEAKKQAVKFVIYACKFALINKGIYVYDNDLVEKEFLNKFSYLGDLSIVKECFNIYKTYNKRVSLNIFKRAVNFIERLSEERLEEFLKRKKWKRK